MQYYLGYIGCFEDPRGSRVLPKAFLSSEYDMTILKCKNHCIDNGYNYAGVEFAKECFCGNDIPYIPAPETDCYMPCTGNKSEKCGGGHRINVYQAYA